MTRSPQHAMAQRLVREALAIAETRGSSAREIRRILRATFALTSITDAIRYAAVRIVTGGGLLDLSDARQPALLERGPRRRRPRSTRKASS